MTTRTRRERSAAASNSWRNCSPACPTTSGPPWSAAPSVTSWASRPRLLRRRRPTRPHPKGSSTGGRGRRGHAQFRGARRGNHGRGTRHRSCLRTAPGQPGRSRRRQRSRRLHTGAGVGRRGGRRGRGGDRRRRRVGHSRPERCGCTVGRTGTRCCRCRQLRTARHPDQQRGHHAVGGPAGRRPGELGAAPRRARRRVVQHDAGGLATHGRTGLRTHCDDDLLGDLRTAEEPVVRDRQGWRHRPDAQHRHHESRPTASRSTSSRRRR